MAVNALFGQELEVINVGLELFRDDLRAQDVKVRQVRFAPPAGGSAQALEALDFLAQPGIAEKISAANEEAVERILKSQPVLVGFDQAIHVVPGMKENMILHAGPPIRYEDMCGAMQGAVTGALVFEGLAGDLEEADRLARSGAIEFSPCHEHAAVGSMAGVTSAHMYVHIVENKTYGNLSYTNLSEQLSKILRFGANDQSVIDRLVWMRDVEGPILKEAMELCRAETGGIDLRLMLSQALHMGDEAHNRNDAGTALLIQALTPYILRTHFSEEEKLELFRFVASSAYFSGPTWMAAAKNCMDAAHGVEYSTIVTTMCRNGVEFGVRVSGMPGNSWFTGPAQMVVGPMFAGYTPADAGLDIGDSAITETFGLGAHCLAAAPATTALIGGTIHDAVEICKRAYEITTAENPNITIPFLNMRGIPTGIDIRKVLEAGALPTIDTAIAHKDAGIGMIGAGITHPPMECFVSAVLALAQRVRELKS